MSNAVRFTSERCELRNNDYLFDNTQPPKLNALTYRDICRHYRRVGYVSVITLPHIGTIQCRSSPLDTWVNLPQLLLPQLMHVIPGVQYNDQSQLPIWCIPGDIVLPGQGDVLVSIWV